MKYYVRTNPGYPDSYEVLLSTTTADTTSFTVTLKAMAPAPALSQWNEVIIDLSEYAGQQGYIAFHHVDYDKNYLLIDDFGIYTVEAAGRWNDAVATGTTLSISGLTPDTDYEWHVQGINANCTGGVTGWSEIATFTTTPSCLVPTDLDVTNITANSAVVTWVSDATSFDIEVNGTVTEGVTIPHTLTLSPNSYYTVRVRANCGVEDGYSEWTSGISFSTPCVAITEYPYQMNFDSYTAYEDELPDCWSRISTSEYYGDYPYIIESEFNSKPNCLYFYSYGDSYYDPQDEYAILPEMENLAGKQITLQAQGYGSIWVGVMTDPTDASTFVAIAPEQALTATYQEFTFNVPADATGRYIAIMMEAPTNYNSKYVYIDDIMVDNPPTCPKPTDFKVTATTTTTATFSWTENGTATAWQIMLDDDEDNLIDVALGDVTIVEDTVSYVLTNLTAGTYFTAMVRAYCDATDQSYWSNKVIFTTECGGPITITAEAPYTQDFESPVVETVYSEEGVVPSCWENYPTKEYGPKILAEGVDYNYAEDGQVLYFYGSGNNYAALPEFTNPLNTLQISFKYATESNSYGTLTLGYITAEDENYNTFHAIKKFDASEDSYQTFIDVEPLLLDTLPTTAARLVFRWYFNSQWGCNIDDVEVSIAPFVQRTQLAAGWNWVSFYVEAEDLLEQLEAGLGENGLTIKSKTQNTAWDEDEEEWVGSLEEFSNDKTYRVQTTAACSVTLTGSANSIPGDYTITINRGWNWIGFPSAVPMSVEVAFSNFEAMAGDQIKSKTQSTAWDEDEEEWSGTLTTLEPGIGFMFYSEHDGVRTLEFPSATSKARGGNSKMSRE
jgi:hypothetical protein